MDKPKIYFIPAYLGPLKHYARLIPYLKDKYDVGFLLMDRGNARFRESAAYCQEKKYPYYVIREGVYREHKIRLPFITTLIERRDHIKECRIFLETVRPAKIIAHKAWHPHDAVFREANLRGIETIVLQWSSDAGLIPPNDEQKTKRSVLQKLYFYLVKIFFEIVDLFSKNIQYRSKPAIPKKIGVFYEDKARYYLESGHDPRSVRIVGSIDLQLVSELKRSIESSPALKNELLKKYDLSPNKLKIIVILYRFYLIGDERFKMTIPEHVAHHYALFKTIREVFTEAEAEVILKIHPTESPMPYIYESYKPLGVKLCGADAKTDELVCLSDLYISDPTSSVNYMALGCGLPAIFVNFSTVQFLNDRMKYFYINQVVSDYADFRNQLRAFKSGSLVKAYRLPANSLESLDNTIALINS